MAFVVEYKKRTQTITADAAGTVIIEKTDQYDVDLVTLNLKNGHASTAWDAAILEFKSHPDAGWVTVESAGWATADNIVLSVANIATLAGAAEMIIRFRTEGVYAWRITVSSNTTAGGPVDVWGVGVGESKGNPIPQ